MAAAAERGAGVGRLAAVLVRPESTPPAVAFGLGLAPALLLSLLFFLDLAAGILAAAVVTAVLLAAAGALVRPSQRALARYSRGTGPTLVYALLVAAFAAPRLPLPLLAAVIAGVVVADHIVAAHLPGVLVSPALLGVAVLAVLQYRLQIPYTNPLDLRPLPEPFALVAETHRSIDPIKLYVGNVPGPVAATSAAAVLLGWAYLSYARRVAAGALAGFAAAVLAAALAMRLDPILQLVSGPSIFVTALLVGDRRHLRAPGGFVVGMGVLAGLLTIGLRLQGQALNAVWEAWLLVGLVASAGVLAWRLLPAPVRAALRLPRRPAPTAASEEAPAVPSPGREHEVLEGLAPRQASVRAATLAPPVRRAAVRRSPALARGRIWTPARCAVLALLLLVVNPLGLVVVWKAPLSLAARASLTALSALWYAAAVAVLLAALHRF